MTFIDAMILIIVLGSLGLIVYCSFFKKHKNPCSSCPVVKRTRRQFKRYRKKLKSVRKHYEKL